MKKSFLSLVLLSCVFVSMAQDQHYIGKTSGQIRTMIQESGSDLFFSKEVKTGNHHFLKFENVDQTKTLLLLLDKQGRVSYTKLMCDYSLLKQMEDSLNSHYQYQKNLTWRDYPADHDYEYVIELNKEEWFFTIRTTRVKK